MNQIERYVMISLSRLLAVGGLAVAAIMALLAPEPALSLRSGALLCGAGAGVMWWRANRPDQMVLPALPAWLMIGIPPMIPLERNRGAFAKATRQVLLRTAPKLAGVAGVMLLISLIV